jgi:hypothetical protein
MPVWAHYPTGVQWNPIAQAYATVPEGPDPGPHPVWISYDDGLMWDPNTGTWSTYVQPPPAETALVLTVVDPMSFSHVGGYTLQLAGDGFDSTIQVLMAPLTGSNTYAPTPTLIDRSHMTVVTPAVDPVDVGVFYILLTRGDGQQTSVLGLQCT